MARKEVYVTMVLSDGYLRGAQVLAASLRDGLTTRKLAVMVPSDEAHRLPPSTLSELEQLYDYVIPVPTFASPNLANLRLLERPDLALTVTKINLWRLVQFEKCVYVDADVLAMRAPDELFNLDVEFAAAPDIGWPDIFNSGVFLFRPNMATYYALKTLAESGVSFDGCLTIHTFNLLTPGGDQGLLNTFFPSYHRLSFTYNVTSSTNYEYRPAYLHFASQISLFHFIGKTKPWSHSQYTGMPSHGEVVSRWWSVYEKHFGWKIREEELRHSQERAIGPPPQHTAPRPQTGQSDVPPSLPSPPATTTRPSSAGSNQKHVSFVADITFERPMVEDSPAPKQPLPEETRPPSVDAPAKQHSIPQRQPSPPPHSSPLSKEVPTRASPPSLGPSPDMPPPPPSGSTPPRLASPEKDLTPPFEPTMSNWDPSRSAPPVGAGPEAKNLTLKAYESVWDKPFNEDEPAWIPPPTTPLPKGYHYTPPAPPRKPDVPVTESEEDEEAEFLDSPPQDFGSGTEISEVFSPQEGYRPVFPWETGDKRLAATRVFPGDEPIPKSESSKPRQSEKGPKFDKYEFTNAWDSLPIIQSYVKQKLGEAPERTEQAPEESKVESPVTPAVPKSVITASTMASAVEGERWDPNRQLDKLRSGVLNKLLEQQRRSPGAPAVPPQYAEGEIVTESSDIRNNAQRLAAVASIVGFIWMSLSSVLTEQKIVDA